jgi:CRP/FNR family cyclic AMP-dependent transcriptional regulator
MNGGSLNWVQVVGYLASLLVFSTFYMKTMIPLRCVAITSNVAFLTYGYFAGLYPVFLLHTVLLPLNVLRLHQMLRLKERVRQSLDRDLSLEWILPFVQRESFKEKEPIFRKGDPADKLYYLERGTVWLPEVERTVHSGQLIGEMGVFSPFKERTGSAVCTTDSTFLVLGERTAIELYYSNPDFGLCMVRTIIRRFLDQQIPSGSRNAVKLDPAMSAMEESPPRGADLDLTQSRAQPRSS